MRLFISINFTEDILEMLYDLREELRRQAVSGNFSRKDNFHLTLAFLGEVPESKIPNIRRAMETSVINSFLLEIYNIGKFTRRGEAVYWVGADGGSGLGKLQKRLTEALKAEGLSPDEKTFRPHITLGRRCRMKASFDEKKLADDLPETSFYVEKISLMKSERIQGKLTYTELMAAELPGHVQREEKKEFFEILTESGEPTGVVRERSLVHRTGEPHATAHVWVIRPNDQGTWDFLLQKRSRYKDSSPGKYDISSAGHVSAGQGYLETAVRELEEELGIHAEAADLEYVGMHRGQMRKIFYGRWFRDHELARVYLYRKPVQAEILRLQEEEVESVRWMECRELYRGLSRQEYPNCLYPDEIRMLLQFLEVKIEEEL